MLRRPIIRHGLPALLFLLSLAAGGYFWLQLRRSAPPAPANFLAADKGYGVTLDPAAYDDRDLSAALDAIAGRGFTWVRVPVRWAELEPEPDRFNWQALDRLVEQVEAAPGRLRLVAVLVTTPAWARPPDTSPTAPPLEISHLGRFARALAARYADHIDYYQIWHEPNLSTGWGNAFVDPAAYADLLREASLNIRAADPTAWILTAALAPTLEPGPLNLSDLAYLDRLYQARGNRWFDIVAAQPYGFEANPADPPRPDALNFRRVELLRQVMLAHGDAGTPIWATAFGWNTLPPDWAGQPAPWGSADEATQARRTEAAIRLARQNWPWLGPMLAVRWDSAGLPPDDPARGFALVDTPEVLAALEKAIPSQAVATPGRYPAGHSSGQYSTGWRFAPPLADIPRFAPRTLTITFEGTDLSLRVNRGPFRGYLWVTVDGQPANALPRDGTGRSYVVLYDPLRGQESVVLARGLPPGRHTAVIEAEGGWGQWAIAGWTVSNRPDPRPAQVGLGIAAGLALLGLLGLGWQAGKNPAALYRAGLSLTRQGVETYNRLGETGHIALTFGLAAALYLSSGLPALALLALLGLAVLFRPDLGLALTAFSLSFFLRPVALPGAAVSPVELALALTVAGFLFQFLLGHFRPRHVRFSADGPAAALVLLSLLATFTAQNFGVSMREWRVVVAESALFYLLVRQGADFSPAAERGQVRQRWVWRLVDALVAGAVLQAGVALYLYFFTDRSITAEGVRRALGLAYGSPNNLALFLDRVWPILLAVTVLPGDRRRRGLYAAGLAVVSLALYLTFSKGALLLGLPVGVVVMVLLAARVSHRAYWRRTIAAGVGGLVVLVLALIPISQTARFQSTFSLESGSTGFFRLKLWQASLTMLKEHWLVGVGLDNFLYQYRTRYILPEAWQEPNLSHPHNILLDFGTRLGVGGVLVLGWLEWTFWRGAWRLYRRDPSPLWLGLMGSMAVFLTHGLVDNSYFLVDLAFVFFLSLGLVNGEG